MMSSNEATVTVALVLKAESSDGHHQYCTKVVVGDELVCEASHRYRRDELQNRPLPIPWEAIKADIRYASQ